MNKDYEIWSAEPTPENMSKVLSSLDNLVTAEASKYVGPGNLLQAKARRLAVDAVKSYTPDRGAALNTWVVSNLRPLSRYSNMLKPVRLPEETNRRVLETMRIRNEFTDQYGKEPSDEELADHIGISVPKIQAYRKKALSLRSEGSLDAIAENSESGGISPMVEENSRLPNIEDAVYRGLNTRDKFIFDNKTGKKTGIQLSNFEIAKRLNVSPTYISQRSEMIAGRIKDLSI